MSPGNLEIYDASYDFGGGSITFAVRPGYSRYRFSCDMHSETLTPVQWCSNAGKYIDAGDAVRRNARAALLAAINSDRHKWTFEQFELIWWGYAYGFERGKVAGRDELAEQLRAKGGAK